MQIERATVELDFDSRVKTWEKLEGKEARTDFFMKNLLDDVVKKIVSSGKATSYKASNLILPVGMSIEPLSIMIRLAEPKKIFFLHTKETLSRVEKIVEYLNLNLGMIQYCEISATETVGYYEKIRAIVLDLSKTIGNDILVDISGGKKSMAAAVGAAAFIVGARVSYVDYDEYLEALRIPKAGSERVIEIENPMMVLGDLEAKTIIDFFNKRLFAAAKELCSELEKKLCDPRRFEVLKLLCEAYELWQNFKFAASLEKMECFFRKSKQYNLFSELREIVVPNKKTLEAICQPGNESEILDRIIKRKSDDVNTEHLDACKHLFLSLYQRGRDEYDSGNIDGAALLFYRAWEMFQQVIFAVRYKTATKNIKYDRCDISREELQIRYQDKMKELFGSEYRHDILPSDVGLLNGAVILNVLNACPLCANLKEIQTFTEGRNACKYTHGFSSIEIDLVNKMEKRVKSVFYNFPGTKIEKDTEKGHVFPQLNRMLVLA